jgi:Tol biopolymer transport system component
MALMRAVCRAITALLALGLVGALLTPQGRAVAPGRPGKIAFRSDRTGYADIYRMNADGSGEIDLTNQHNWNDQAAWSPDGKQIVFTSERDDLARMRGQVYVMNADGSGQRNISRSPYSDSVPDWSPDGGKIAFRRDLPSATHIWTMNPDGSDQHDLTPADSNDISPSWSPDGTRIAYSGLHHDIWVMNADGTNPTDITNDGMGNFEPSWGGARGDQIVFTSTRDGHPDLWIMSDTGAGKHRLTAYPSLESSWAPDGSKIVFNGAPGGNLANSDIYAINPDGSAQQDLTASDASANYEPSWQPVPAGPGSGGSPGASPPHCVVPRLRGLTLARARRALIRAHCRLGRVRHRQRHHRGPPVVRAQSVSPGSRLAPRSQVSVLVA